MKLSKKSLSLRRNKLLYIALIVLSSVSVISVATAEGVVWERITLNQALDKAKALDQMVMIDVYSDHCMQCGEMDMQLWDTAEGAELAEGLITMRIASDKPEAFDINERYPILGLPLVIFIKPDGEEFGRIVGYNSHFQWVSDAQMLKNWVDPRPALEEQLEANPNDLQSLYNMLEQNIYDKKEIEADLLLRKIITIEGEANSPSFGPRGMALIAKYWDYFRRDKATSQSVWKSQVEKYAHSNMTGSGVKATFEYARSTGQTEAWVDWICPIVEKNSNSPRFCYSVAMQAFRNRTMHPCLGKAARIALANNIGPAYMDSIAVVLEGGN